VAGAAAAAALARNSEPIAVHTPQIGPAPLHPLAVVDRVAALTAAPGVPRNAYAWLIAAAVLAVVVSVADASVDFAAAVL
jgi:hypothetical protein